MPLHRWNRDELGPPSEAAMRALFESLGYRCSVYVYPPGTVFPEHTHGVDKLDGVVSGRFRITLEGEEILLGSGDWVEVPRGVVHRAEVVGAEPVVSVDAIRD